jgi:hypothetical protein
VFSKVIFYHYTSKLLIVDKQGAQKTVSAHCGAVGNQRSYSEFPNTHTAKDTRATAHCNFPRSVPTMKI